MPDFSTMVEMFDHVAGRWPERTAMISGEARLSYRAYRHGAGVLAERLWSLGVERGGRVAVFKGNSIELSIAAQAIWAAGAQLVLLNPLYTARELGPLLLDAAPAVLLCDDDLMALAAPLAAEAGIAVLAFQADGLTDERGDESADRPLPGPPPGPGEPASLVYTGGTTGLPKAAFHSHATTMAHIRMHDATWRLGEPGQTVLNVAPQSHVWGLAMTLQSPLLGGATIVNVPRFQPAEVLEALVRHRVTVFTGGPSTVYNALMGLPEIATADLGALERCFGGGAPFAEETVRAWQGLTGNPILEGYGMSEAGPICGNPLDRPRPGSVGLAMPGMELEVVDVESATQVLAPDEAGEIRVRGPNVCSHYWQRPEETAQAIRGGWLYTGDIGLVDAEGYVCIVERKKDMAITGGYNVYPREIDEVLFAHPAVQEAAAVAVPDAHWGEVLWAYAVLSPGQTADADELMDWCRERLAKYKIPARIELAEGLPKTPANKIDKRALRELARK
jgi:long-chain acyl-CoA synthetase